MSNRGKGEPLGMSIRAAAARLGKAPQTVGKMIRHGELVLFTVTTEAGHVREYVTTESVEACERAEKQSAA
jgi:transposase